jgi:hypothetical protein
VRGAGDVFIKWNLEEMALRVLLRDILLFCVVGNEDYHAW